MAIGKKGIIFTLMAIILVAFLISSQAVGKSTTATSIESEAARVRVNAMDSYLDTFEDQAQNSLAGAGYFALRNASKKILIEKTFLTDVNATLSDCIINNHIRIGATDYQCLPVRQQMNYSLNQLILIAQTNLSIRTAYIVNSIWVTEENPDEIIFWANISYNITDQFATWNINGKIIRAAVDVAGIEDPVYQYDYANGFTSEQRNFSLSPFKLGQFNITVFNQYYGNHSYIIQEGRAPSVLQRFLGQTANVSSCCGIESVMTRSALLAVNTSYMNLSLVDFQFTANKQGKLALSDCGTGQVKALAVSGGRLVLDAVRFDNRYNLTASEALPICQWP